MSKTQALRQVVKRTFQPPALITLIALSFMIATACGGDEAQSGVTPAATSTAPQETELPAPDQATSTLEEIVEAMNASMTPPFQEGKMRPLDCTDSLVEHLELCLHLAQSTISATEATLSVNWRNTTAFWEVTLRKESGRWIVTDIIDRSG